MTRFSLNLYCFQSTLMRKSISWCAYSRSADWKWCNCQWLKVRLLVCECTLTTVLQLSHHTCFPIQVGLRMIASVWCCTRTFKVSSHTSRNSDSNSGACTPTRQTCCDARSIIVLDSTALSTSTFQLSIPGGRVRMRKATQNSVQYAQRYVRRVLLEKQARPPRRP